MAYSTTNSELNLDIFVYELVQIELAEVLTFIYFNNSSHPLLSVLGTRRFGTMLAMVPR